MKALWKFLLWVALTIGLQPWSWSDEFTGDLLDIVEGFAEEDPELQYEAYAQLAAFVAHETAPGQPDGAEKVTRGLLDCLDTPGVSEEAKKYIIRQLARVGTGSAVAPLSKIMSGKNAFLAELARQALEQIGDPKASNALKKAIGQAPDDASRQTYIRTLANRKDPDTLGYFSRMLQADDSLLAIESIHALAKMGTAEATQALQRAYRSKPAPELRIDLERALIALDDTADNLLAQIQTSGINSANRQAALVRLVELGHGQAVKLLRSSLSGSDPDLRRAAIHLALAHGKQFLVQDEVESLSNDDWRIVLGGLSAFSGRVAEDLALKAAEEGNMDIQVQAIRALATYGKLRSSDLLLQYFAGPDKALKQAAIYAIERMPGTALNSRLQKMLNSDSEQDAVHAIEALIYRDLPNAKNRLFRFVSGENSILAREALRTLSSIADEEDLYRLFFLAKRTDNEDLSKMITSMLKKVALEIGSLEFQAKVRAL